MKREELLFLLTQKKVPHQSYSLDGLKNGECLCVVNRDGSWQVVYNSQGRITSVTECQNEEDAYEELYRQISDAYGW
ncbi:hypothetical protein ACOMICROBIO_LKFPLAJE_03592 [Vibrio sp. B1FIG11]|uniref:hypothetical protein n=1 Tax=Vibrio sp. B1FIG11 TaxID=2751177 RepID=UPI0015F66569|nr:hypothetical protein [Vibrio sp. B1FIG11]CAE6938879.1 hypothetical protein ACOMICROBIO_LKFPLAJE_03592 [Vibrio sp. B1FIG11]